MVSEKRRPKASLSQRDENNIAQLSTGEAIDTEDLSRPKTIPKIIERFKEKGKGVRTINKNITVQISGEYTPNCTPRMLGANTVNKTEIKRENDKDSLTLKLLF